MASLTEGAICYQYMEEGIWSETTKQLERCIYFPLKIEKSFSKSRNEKGFINTMAKCQPSSLGEGWVTAWKAVLVWYSGL